jgi:hypothetical protein
MRVIRSPARGDCDRIPSAVLEERKRKRPGRACRGRSIPDRDRAKGQSNELISSVPPASKRS